MNITIKGRFKASGEKKETSNGKTVQKFYLDLDTDTQYPTMCEIQNFDNKVDISNLKPGDMVTVHVNLTGRKWESPEGKKYFFQSLTAWKIENETKEEHKMPEELPGMSDDLPF